MGFMRKSNQPHEMRLRAAEEGGWRKHGAFRDATGMVGFAAEFMASLQFGAGIVD